MSFYPSRGLFILVAFFSVVPASVGLQILAPAELRVNYSTPEFSCLVLPLSAEGPLIVYSSALTLESLADKIVLLQANLTGPLNLAGIRNEVAFNLVAEYGPLGIIYTNPVVDQAGASETLIFYPEACKNLTIPVVEIDAASSAALVALFQRTQANSTSLLVRIDIGDPNPWREARHGAIGTSFMAIFASLAGLCTSLAVVKYFAFVRVTGFRFNIAQICLALEFFANLFRMIYLSLDPIYAGRLFLAHQAHMMSTITWPFTIITALLITLWWLDVLNANHVAVPHFLKRMRIPFFIMSSLLLALELGTSASRALSLGAISMLTTIAAVIYAAILLATMLLFTVVGIGTLRQLRQGNRLGNVASQRLVVKTTKLVMASGFFSLFWIVATLLASVKSVFWTVKGFYLTWSLSYIGLLGISLNQILSFTPPSSDDHSEHSGAAVTSKTASAAGSASLLLGGGGAPRLPEGKTSERQDTSSLCSGSVDEDEAAEAAAVVVDAKTSASTSPPPAGKTNPNRMKSPSKPKPKSESKSAPQSPDL